MRTIAGMSDSGLFFAGGLGFIGIGGTIIGRWFGWEVGAASAALSYGCALICYAGALRIGESKKQEDWRRVVRSQQEPGGQL